jgi:NAD(P)-dependent dehydrogenase (short-subunit alcohol dehydrogenase family)
MVTHKYTRKTGQTTLPLARAGQVRMLFFALCSALCLHSFSGSRMNQIDLKGRNAVITGGARGIGLAIARRMLESGAAVALWDRDAGALAEAAKTLAAGSRVTTETVDLVDDKAVGAATASSIARLKAIDILVNNAGIAGANMKTWEYTPADFREIIEINMISQYLVCRAVVPHMIERKYGRIINIASIAGKEGTACPRPASSPSPSRWARNWRLPELQ